MAEDIRKMPDVRSATKVTVAFPFSSINIETAEFNADLAELGRLVAGLAEQLEQVQPSEQSAELQARARELLSRLESR